MSRPAASTATPTAAASQPRNLCYAQSGGVTAVINATAAAIISEAKAQPRIGKVYAGKNGILGILREELYETWHETPTQINALRHTPGGAFGSCRYKLPDPRENTAPYRRLLEVCRAHRIGTLLYNGGNDSADTSLKIAAAMKTLGGDLTCIGVPKTIDNDLPATDCCPGFGSVAKYVAVSVMETTRDLAAMARTSTKVFILEVMGRHAGWIAAAAGLAGEANGPLIILFPEVPFNRPAFLAALAKRVTQHGYAVVVVSEGLRDAGGQFLAAAAASDSFSHRQLGGVAPRIAAEVTQGIGYKCHWAVADYMQRSARHLASATDVRQAEAVGRAAVRLAARGANGVMPVCWRISDEPYRWEIGEVPLKRIANRERKLPANFISADKYFITAACRRYLAPLIQGEDAPPYKNGLPVMAQLKNKLAAQKLPGWTEG